MSRSGAGPYRATCDQLRPLLEAGVVGFKCFLLDSGVPEFPPLDDAGLRASADRAGRRRRAADRPRRGRRRDRGRAATVGPSYARVPRLAARGGRGVGDRCAGRGGPRHGGAGPRRAPRRRRRAAPAAAGPGRRGADHGGDLPALPDVRRGGGARRGDVLQVLPPDPGGAAPRGALGGAHRRRRRSRGQRPLTLHARPQAARRRRLRRGLGRDRLAAGGPARGVDRRPGARHRARPGRALDGRRPRRGWPGCPARGRSPSARTPTWSPSRPTRRGRSATSSTATRSRPTPGGRSSAPSAGRGCAGSRPTGHRSAGCSSAAVRPRCPSCPSRRRSSGRRRRRPRGRRCPRAVSAGRCST